jgi:hypothetical protein
VCNFAKCLPWEHSLAYSRPACIQSDTKARAKVGMQRPCRGHEDCVLGDVTNHGKRARAVPTILRSQG